MLLPDILPESPVNVTIHLTLPGTPEGCQCVAFLNAPGDPELANNSSSWMLAALTNGVPPQPMIETYPQMSELVLSIDTLGGVRYREERSVDLLGWDLHEEFIGSGYPHAVFLPLDKDREFFRFTVVEPPRSSHACGDGASRSAGKIEVAGQAGRALGSASTVP
ncbi:MAG: hypothetical protein RLZZ522_831 [Verrucomicrobiota bacterium]